jgi:hypothetical protein
MIILEIDGQDLQIDDDERVKTDEQIRQQILQPFYPAMANAKLERITEEGKPLRIKVVKRAGSNGSALQSFIDAPATANPAIVLSWQLRAKQLSPDDYIHYCVHHCRTIQEAIDSGTRWCQQTNAALIQLKQAKAVPSQTPVQGV